MIATIANSEGSQLTVELSLDGNRWVGQLVIDGVPCHIERLEVSQAIEAYVLDRDPAYKPRSDQMGYTYLVVPFSI
jgi:hypothetical protein